MKRKAKTSPLLADVVTRMCDERALRSGTATQHRLSVRTFERFLGRKATVDDLNVELFNRYVTWLRAELPSSHSAHGRRKLLLSSWFYAAQVGLTEVEPVSRRLARVRTHLLQPRCWDLPQIVHLLETASKDDRRMRRGKGYYGIRWNEFWRAFVLVGYHSGLRLGDLQSLRCGQVGDDGRLFHVMNKTGEELVATMPPEAVAAVRALERMPRKLLFRDLCSNMTLFREFRFLLAKAGLPGSIKWLRRSGATWCEVNCPGSASAFLGHKSPGVAQRHYIDRRHLQVNKPAPPPLPIGA